MKSGGLGAVQSSYGVPAKRRWRGLIIAVLGLVILSMLVPLVFLLGLHNSFHTSGYIYEQRNTPSSPNIIEYNRHDVRHKEDKSEGDKTSHVKELITKFEPTLPKDVLKNYSKGDKNGIVNTNEEKHRGVKTPPPLPPNAALQSPPTTNTPKVHNPKHGRTEQVTHPKTSSADETGTSCELTYGSYCLWQQEHKEVMKDAMVKKLKDQLFVARAYYPSIAKLPAQDKLSRQLKQSIQELEHVLSESSTDADLPPLVETKSERMDVAIARAKSVPVVCDNVDKKFRQLYDLTEDEADFHRKQSAFLYKLNVLTMPKSFHCLALKLTVEYFKSSHDEEEADSEKFEDSSLHHYVIFSNNVLAASVVINSTVTHAKVSRNQVFHVLSDGQNYYAMKLWFKRNNYGEAAVQVLNVEHLEMDSLKDNSLQLSLPEEFRVSFRSYDNPSMGQFRTEYISIFSHSHYLLPDIFSKLKKVVVLDDDVVIQRDLSSLWNLDMGEKVNGAVQFCSVRLGQLKGYLGEKGFSHNSCAWMSGLNIIDLVRWREFGLTQTYKRLIKELSVQKGSTTAAAWPASLLAFENKIYPLNESWVRSGLGHDYKIDSNSIKSAPVLHYNGKMKPWLDLGIPNYKSYWKKYLNKEDQLLSECNVNS
ncbi:putative polygalacturonate 4-alpha-galacturonosyltransferase [Medicago truncatula]|uniref:Hexosyltransferase n=1 Tax=Medicago truncatula TaxID=3880 RepID=A2Q3W2_MEDTR|nr:probable galacturonosyltransferase 7 isoform X1 [Medicago truncatula]ABN08312.1 Glycosyl transferase, family 8 [Medicago truncatula]AES79920.1 glycosyltransferase family 8 protein [Medicago truncatula]RHN46757.1 putative polygalacturonate 4-alpha-galacturonosyltransferase [Medicago truncatula]